MKLFRYYSVQEVVAIVAVLLLAINMNHAIATKDTIRGGRGDADDTMMTTMTMEHHQRQPMLDAHGCPDFVSGFPDDIRCNNNTECAMGSCCANFYIGFCHPMPSLCRASLQCMVDGEDSNNINDNQQQTRSGGNIQVPLPLNQQIEDSNQPIQVYEDRNGNDVVEIVSGFGEDIKVYQNVAGEEVIEIAQTEDNFHKVTTSSQPHKPQQHHFGERKPAAAHKVQTATARHREYVQPEAIENTSGDGSSPDGDTIFGPCTPDQLHAYMYLTIDEDDLFDVGGAVRLHRKGDYPLIWDEDDFEYDETYVGEECLDNTKCWIFVVESTQGYGWQEGKLTFYVNDQLKLELEDTYSFDSSDSLDVFDDLSPWKHKIEFGDCEWV